VRRACTGAEEKCEEEGAAERWRGLQQRREVELGSEGGRKGAAFMFAFVSHYQNLL